MNTYRAVLFAFSLAPQQLPCAPWLPRIIFAESPWWQAYIPALIGLVQFLILAGLTYFIYWSNATQKIRERQADWYHKVVVDHAVEKLKELFGQLQKDLFTAAEEVDTLRATDIDKARERCKGAIAKAKLTIFELRSEMGFRLSVFNPQLEHEFTQQLELLENKIVDWFTRQPDRHPYDSASSLPTLLAKAQIQLLRQLMRHEFSTWGLSWPWTRRGM